MKMRPPRGDCTLCRNVVIDGGEVQEMIVCEGMDINWGEDMNICSECAGVIADLIDRPENDEVEKLRGRVIGLNRRLEDLQAEFVRVSDLNARMIEGAKAKKASKERVAA